MDPKTTIFTIGHGTLRLDEFLGLLHSQGIRTVLDVRSQPHSRTAPQYSRKELEAELNAAGLGYRWLGDRLGGRPIRDGELPPVEDPGKLEAGVTDGAALASGATCVLMCAERDPDSCHRSLAIADRFEHAGFVVRHLLSDGSVRTHQPRLDW